MLHRPRHENRDVCGLLVGNELVIYDADGGAIWSLDLAPVGLEEEQTVVFTVFQQNGDLVQYAEGG